jgi:hypothetical protein
VVEVRAALLNVKALNHSLQMEIWNYCLMALFKIPAADTEREVL